MKKPIKFRAKCIDARYGLEELYLKTIESYSIKQTVFEDDDTEEIDLYESYLKYLGTWVEVDMSTLEIIKGEK